MNKIIKIISLFLPAVFFLTLPSASQRIISAKFTGEITTNNPTHIARITKDSIVVITGSTYAFTVDTHPDSGLVSTRTTVTQLLSQIKSKDGLKQQYLVRDKAGIQRE